MVRKLQIIVGLRSNFAFTTSKIKEAHLLVHSLWYVTGWCKFKCTPLPLSHWHRMALGPSDPSGRFSSSSCCCDLAPGSWHTHLCLISIFFFFFFSPCFNYIWYPSFRLLICWRIYGLSCLVFKVSEWGGTLICSLSQPVSIWSNDSVGKLLLGGAVAPCLLPSKANKAQMNR